MKYSVAIRTLGTNPSLLRMELESIYRQSIRPDRVIIYIAKGYAKPDFRIGDEEYVEVEKGMVGQRALRYKEIDSDYLLLLDDDVTLAPDSVEILLRELAENNADCVAADTFESHNLALSKKIKAGITSWVFPHTNQKWAVMIHANGSFSYINHVKKSIYPSQSAAGPCALWRKNSLLSLNFQDEKWMDTMGFAYGDDELEFYKLYANRGKLMVSFDAGVIHHNGKSASSGFKADNKHFYIRSKVNYLRWYRMIYHQSSGFSKFAAALAYSAKTLWLVGLHAGISAVKFDVMPVYYFIQGVRDGIKYARSAEFLNLPPYKDR